MGMRKRRKDHSEAKTDIEIDMTPLIDVVFLLIIFFMIVSTFNQMERDAVKELPVSRFQAAVEPDITKDRMVVNILEDGTISLYGQPYTVEGFREQLARYRPALQRIGRETDRAPIIIRGHRNARYEVISQVLRSIYEYDFRNIMFAAHEPRKEPE